MQDTMRIGAAALGGYVLGRTKKAKTAITLALWLSGKGRPSDMVRTQAVKALQSDKGQEMLTHLRGPVLEAGKTAALSMFEVQAGRLSDSMSKRTDALTAIDGGKSNGKTKAKSSRRARSEDDDDEQSGDDELSERRRPSGRKPDRDRRPPEDRDIEEDEDDEDDYADEYDDEADEDEEEDDEDEDAEEYEDEYDDEEYEDEDDDDRATTRRRAS